MEKAKTIELNIHAIIIYDKSHRTGISVKFNNIIDNDILEWPGLK